MSTRLIFFYGTLLNGFRHAGLARLERSLAFVGRGVIEASLFDLGPYPGAIRCTGSSVWGEIYQMLDVPLVLDTLDDFEDYRVDDPGASLYIRVEVAATMIDPTSVVAWAYFYNRSVDNAVLIPSGDYRQYLAQHPRRAKPS
jgi:gamma-glutamylcyclotransferase (GGCT)/AIG2-like uncharacterized protein YtfP